LRPNLTLEEGLDVEQGAGGQTAVEILEQALDIAPQALEGAPFGRNR
jgi:hypothetical protein